MRLPLQGSLGSAHVAGSMFALAAASISLIVLSESALSYLVLGAALGSIGISAWHDRRRHTIEPLDFSDMRSAIPRVVSMQRPDSKSVEYEFLSGAVCVGRRVEFDIGRQHFALVAHGINDQSKDGILRADIRIAAGVDNTAAGYNTRTIASRRHLIAASSPDSRTVGDCVFSVELVGNRLRLFILWIDAIETADRRFSFTLCSSLD